MIRFSNKVDITSNRPLSPQSPPSAVGSKKSNQSNTSASAPSAIDFPNAPQNYVKALEKHFGCNMENLYNHLQTLSSNETESITAIVDGSHEFRRFLGITDPNSLKNKIGRALLGSSSRIKDTDAPLALAIAATKSKSPERVQRSLERLDKSLDNLLKMLTARQISHNVYRDVSNTAFTKLAQEFGNLPTKEAFEKAVNIFEHTFNVRRPPLSTEGLKEFVVSIKNIKSANVMTTLGIDDKVKESLDEMAGFAKELIKLGRSYEMGRIKANGAQYLIDQKNNLEKDGVKSIIKNNASNEKRKVGFVDSSPKTPASTSDETNPTLNRHFHWNDDLSRQNAANSSTPHPQENASSSVNRNTHRNDLMWETGAVNPKLKQKVAAIKLKEIKKQDANFYQYVEQVAAGGRYSDILELEQKNLRLFATVENSRNPELNLNVFDNPKDCYNAIEKLEREGKTGYFRFIYPPLPETMPSFHIPLEVHLKPGEKPSITAFNPILPNQNLGLKRILDTSRSKHPEIKQPAMEIRSCPPLSIIEQMGQLHGSDIGDSMMISLDLAMKSAYSQSNRNDAFIDLIRSVNDFRNQTILNVAQHLTKNK